MTIYSIPMNVSIFFDNKIYDYEQGGFKQEDGCDDYDDDDGDTDDDEDDYEDPYENLTVDELKNRLPPYLFMDEEEKKVYLRDLSETYKNELNNAMPFAKKKKKIFKVKFDQKRNETMRKFFLFLKISF